MRIVFMGASDLGWKCCRALLDMGQDIAGIFSIPREFRISWSVTPVTNVRYRSFQDLATEHGIPLTYVTNKLNTPEHRNALLQLRPDVLLAVGWYYMIPRPIRDLARLGAVGVHASLLPQYRGGAPLVWAMINGESTAGVSLFHLADGVDDGDVIGQERFEIGIEDDISAVIDRATEASVTLMRKYVPLLASGRSPRLVQPESLATRVPQRRPEDGVIDWHSQSAWQVYNWVRAQTRPYPGAFTYLAAETIRVWRVSLCSRPIAKPTPPGSLLVGLPGVPDACAVSCADGRHVLLQEVSLDDGTVLTGAELVRVRKLRSGDMFAQSEGERSTPARPGR